MERGLATSPVSALLGTSFDLEPMITSDIFQWAGATPERSAVIHNGRSLTYRELADRCVALICHLQTHELQPGSTAVIVIRSLLSSWIAIPNQPLSVLTQPARARPMGK